MAEYGRKMNTDEASDRRNRMPYYVNGTAVPQQIPEEPSRRPELPKQPRQTDPQVRRNRERAMHIDLPYLMFLSAAAAALMFTCFSLLQSHAYITEQRLAVRQNQQTLQTLRGNNDALENALDASLDLEEIYRIATEEYHMVYPADDQIIYYQNTDNGYVRQYEDIPTD